MYPNNKRYYTLDCFYKEKFQCKIAKVSLNGNFTCPNRDGTKGVGGCIYCSNLKSGDYAGDYHDDIVTQFNNIKKVMLHKWKDAKFIGYFQAGTNTPKFDSCIFKNCFLNLISLYFFIHFYNKKTCVVSLNHIMMQRLPHFYS